MRCVAALVLALAAACTDEAQRFLFVSSEGVRAADVETDCDCDLEVFANGACEHWTDTGPLCGCLSVGPGSLEVVRDGVVVAASEPKNPSLVRGDFAGAQVRLLVERATYTLDLPAEYPPAPQIVTATDNAVAWTLDRPLPVDVSAGGTFAGSVCHADAAHTSIATAPSAGWSVDVTALDEVREQSGVRVIMTATAHATIPPSQHPLPGIPTPDPKHLRAP